MARGRAVCQSVIYSLYFFMKKCGIAPGRVLVSSMKIHFVRFFSVIGPFYVCLKETLEFGLVLRFHISCLFIAAL